MRNYGPIAGILVGGMMLAGCAAQPDDTPSQLASTQSATEVASAGDRPIADTVYWGDLHLHTNRSFDAYSLGNTRLGPEDAYKFARGEAVTASSGLRAQLDRPLDFLMVADHAEYLGVVAGVVAGTPGVADTPLGQRWASYLKGSDVAAVTLDMVAMMTGQKPAELPAPAFQSSIWASSVSIADRYNDPGRFTAFAGYEWTSMPGGRNMHRVVVFRDGAEKVTQVLPFSAMDSDDPEHLWDYLERYEAKTGGKVMAIAHNGNLSGGLMFDETTLSGKAIDAAYATRRMRWEPVYEVTQVKGDGETHPLLAPDDEFADFERWDKTDISMQPKPTDPAALKTMMTSEYARSALTRGLVIGQAVGANPYKFGLLGSTDSHTSLATADDSNFFGKFRDSEPSPGRSSEKIAKVMWPNWDLTSSGYTGVWASENSREALFDALQRKEVYATTGPRITLRVFAGWDFSDADLRAPDMAQRGYARGVPMGGELAGGPAGRAGPRLLIIARKDADGANLDRVQVIKGTVSADGSPREQVIDVALSGGRKVDPATGKVPDVGSTVDPDSATYTNSIGAPELTTVWQDPDFDPSRPAYYYVRVIEIPTPRWTSYDKARLGAKPDPTAVMVTRERAYSSPVWYTPPAPARAG